MCGNVRVKSTGLSLFVWELSLRVKMDEEGMERHERYMSVALEEARMALERGEVPVGCVLVDESSGNIVGRGSNRSNEKMNATRHAEIEAFENMWGFAKKNEGHAFRANVLVYVTVEPCIMCAAMLLELLKNSEKRLVVFGCSNERFGGCGSVRDVHTGRWSWSPQGKLHGLEILSGVLKEEAIQLLERFFEQTNPLAPAPKVKKPRLGT